eukprot:CAMPEP_0170313892 /NCGR_PEP_ID=MMETSP0116_2-20130129/57513_1 /TAXON_ID=400756 /ORGANISM="Durinskia baltica, Strain CSIRO CS-38" /LENGTH=108 /DNA_ID=CAMNT_0010566329 /DNA_START=1 /DNA_END=324 /DNA_ORIENTATION=+
MAGGTPARRQSGSLQDGAEGAGEQEGAVDGAGVEGGQADGNFVHSKAMQGSPPESFQAPSFNNATPRLDPSVVSNDSDVDLSELRESRGRAAPPDLSHNCAAPAAESA